MFIALGGGGGKDRGARGGGREVVSHPLKCVVPLHGVDCSLGRGHLAPAALMDSRRRHLN